MRDEIEKKKYKKKLDRKIDILFKFLYLSAIILFHKMYISLYLSHKFDL